MRRALGRRSQGRHGRRGAALVEMAIVLPVLLLLLFGIIEFGQIMFVRQTLINSAKEGAMRATRPGATPENVRQTVQQALEDGGLGSYDVAVEYTPSNPPDNLAERVKVSIDYADVSLIGGFFDNFPLTSTCTMFRGPLGF